MIAGVDDLPAEPGGPQDRLDDDIGHRSRRRSTCCRATWRLRPVSSRLVLRHSRDDRPGRPTTRMRYRRPRPRAPRASRSRPTAPRRLRPLAPSARPRPRFTSWMWCACAVEMAPASGAATLAHRVAGRPVRPTRSSAPPARSPQPTEDRQERPARRAGHHTIIGRGLVQRLPVPLRPRSGSSRGRS